MRRLIQQGFQLALDPALRSYWISRGLIASVFFLFGILLRESGYTNIEVIVAWIVVYIAQSALLITLDTLNRRYEGAYNRPIVMLCTGAAIAYLFVMSLIEINLVGFTLVAVLMLPVLRECIHNGTLYIRDERTWALGKNLASLYANEMGKGFGAAFIFAMGYFSDLGSTYVAGFLLVLMSLSMAQYLSHHRGKEKDTFTGSADIGAGGIGYVRISFLHNGCFTSIKAILSLVVFDVLNQSRDLDSVITVLASVVSVMMVVGLILYQVFQERLIGVLRHAYRTHFISQAIGLLTLISISLTLTVYAFSWGWLGNITTGYLISIGISLLMALGGLFTLGALQYLDDIFGDTNDPQRHDRRKTTLHRAWVSSSLAPALILGLYCLGNLYLDSLANALLCLTVISIIEVGVTVYSHRLSLRQTN